MSVQNARAQLAVWNVDKASMWNWRIVLVIIFPPNTVIVVNIIFLLLINALCISDRGRYINSSSWKCLLCWGSQQTWFHCKLLFTLSSFTPLFSSLLPRYYIALEFFLFPLPFFFFFSSQFLWSLWFIRINPEFGHLQTFKPIQSYSDKVRAPLPKNFQSRYRI